jgi:hypothetical protein
MKGMEEKDVAAVIALSLFINNTSLLKMVGGYVLNAMSQE